MKGALIITLSALALAYGAKIQANPIDCRRGDYLLLRDEDCSRFRQCQDGVVITQSCPEGLHFDIARGKCNWPQIAECQSEPSNIDVGEEIDSEVFDVSDPGQASAICAIPSYHGALVAHEICNNFYKCSYGKPVPLKCPLNLLYNTGNKQCDWPVNVDCGNRTIKDIDEDQNESGDGETTETDSEKESVGHSDPSLAPKICAAEDSESTLVAHENCNQFYKCSQGVPVGLQCPLNLLYNPAKEYCDWPENVNCETRIIPETHRKNLNDSTVSEAYNPKSRFSRATNEKQYDVHSDPSKAPLVCTSKDSDGVLVAHEHCNEFYKCSQGVPVVLRCPVNLLYNPIKKYCDWPHNVDCEGRNIPENEKNEIDQDHNGNETADTESSGCSQNQVHDNPNEAPVICAAEGSDGILIAHHYCNHFYKCFEGYPVALVCPTKLFYNPSKKYCDWPKLVDCGNRLVPENHAIGDGNSTNGAGNGSMDNDLGEDSDPGEALDICAAEHSDGVLVPHEYCNYFYKCSQGYPVALVCPGKLLYNPGKYYCDWPLNVDCGNRTVYEHGSKNDDDEDNDNDDDDNDQNENTSHSDSSLAHQICAMNNSDGVLVAHEECNKFFKCSKGAAVALDCPGNLLYDSNKKFCDWPQNVDCGSRTLEKDEEVNEEDEDVNGDEAQIVNICAESEGKLIAHENCDQFYKCTHGRLVPITCPSGLLYNVGLEVCDWPSNVVCDNRIKRRKLHKRYLDAKQAVRFLFRMY